MKPEDIAFVEERLGYTFKNKNLLIRALTRKAFALEQKQQGRNYEDQEVYRILGDAVIKAILVEMLIEQRYDSREAITNRKIELEKRENLGIMLRKMDLIPFIQLGRGEKKQEISKQSSVLGETFEALIAAIHVDGGSYERTKRLVVKLFSSPVPNSSTQTVFQETAHEPNLDDDKLWMVYEGCDACFQPQICPKVRICYFDL